MLKMSRSPGLSPMASRATGAPEDTIFAGCLIKITTCDTSSRESGRCVGFEVQGFNSAFRSFLKTLNMASCAMMHHTWSWTKKRLPLEIHISQLVLDPRMAYAPHAPPLTISEASPQWLERVYLSDLWSSDSPSPMTHFHSRIKLGNWFESLRLVPAMC